MPTQPYEVNGTPVPGVTTILKQQDSGGLIAAANSLGLKGRAVYGPKGEWTRAADIGTACHALIQAHLQNEPIDQSKYDEDVLRLARMPYNSFLGWREGRALTGTPECSLIHSEMLYGGTMDLLGDTYIFDWKTSTNFRFRDGLYAQVGGYTLLAEHHGHKINLCTVVRFPKEGGSAESLEIPTNSEKARAGRDLFLSLLSAWKARKIINQKEER